DEPLAKAARAAVDAWLKNPDEPIVAEALIVAARRGDKALFQSLHSAAADPKRAKVQVMILAALRAFSDPALAKQAREIVIGGKFALVASMAILGAQLQDPTMRGDAYAFLKAHLGEMIDKLGYVDFSPYLDGFCTTAERDDVATTFAKYAEPKNLKTTL